ncbi:MAG: hypothetical protein PVF83_16225 [Anaerolineales bacterium]|jgi:hypothetical protein
MRIRIRNTIGTLLIIGGVLLILEKLDIFSGDVVNIIWAVVCSVLGGFFLSKFFARRENWGWLIPGLSFLGIGISNLLELIPSIGDTYSELIILCSIGLSLVLIYINDRLHWWALVPGGLLISLGVGSIVERYNPVWVDSGSILFLGLGLSFLILFIIPTPYGRLKWAFIPALILLAIGSIVAIEESLAIGNFVGPAIIIILGILVLVNVIKR